MSTRKHGYELDQLHHHLSPSIYSLFLPNAIHGMDQCLNALYLHTYAPSHVLAIDLVPVTHLGQRDVLQHPTSSSLNSNHIIEQLAGFWVHELARPTLSFPRLLP